MKAPTEKVTRKFSARAQSVGTEAGHIEILPDSMQDIPEGFIAFLDTSATLFCGGGPRTIIDRMMGVTEVRINIHIEDATPAELKRCLAGSM